MYRQCLAQENEEENEESHTEEYQRIHGIIKTLPAVHAFDEASTAPVVFKTLNYKELVSLPRQHQTKQAALRVHTQQDLAGFLKPEATLHQQVIWQLHEVLCEHQDSKAGQTRIACWHHSMDGKGIDAGLVPDVNATVSPLNGNTANAVAISSAVAQKVSSSFIAGLLLMVLYRLLLTAIKFSQNQMCHISLILPTLM